MKKPQINLNNEAHFSFRVPERQRQYLKKLWTPPVNNDADTIMQWLYDRGLVQNYIRKLEYDTIDEETIKDEIQEVWLYILEKKDKMKELYDTQGITGLTAYVSGIISRTVHSNSSLLYKKYKKDYKTIVHLSDKAWEVFDTTGEMIPTNTDYLTSETEDDIIKQNIENNEDYE